MTSRTVSDFDVHALSLIRQNVDAFMADCAARYAHDQTTVLLDVAPQDHKGAAPFFGSASIATLDIDPKSAATYIADLCDREQILRTIGRDKFDFVVCTEVLEHTRQPFHAAQNIFEILKPGELVFVTTPYNFRIHGPLPDCWRFTEHGLRELFKAFEIVALNELETPERFLMPIQYTLVARKPPTPSAPR